MIYTPTRAYNKPYYIPADLHSADDVFLRRDAVRKPLTPNYTGPHLVISRSPKYFVIDITGKHNTVSIDRLKPSYMQDGNDNSTTQDATQTELPHIQTHPTDTATTIKTTCTKSGRHVHWPTKFRTYITY